MFQDNSIVTNTINTIAIGTIMVLIIDLILEECMFQGSCLQLLKLKHTPYHSQFILLI